MAVLRPFPAMAKNGCKTTICQSQILKTVSTYLPGFSQHVFLHPARNLLLLIQPTVISTEQKHTYYVYELRPFDAKGP